MTESTSKSPFQTVYDELLQADSGWSRLFSNPGDVREGWARELIDRLGVMVAGEKIEFVTSSTETVHFDHTARATIFTTSRIIELAPSTLTSGNYFEPPEVFTFSRSELSDAKLVEHKGDLSGPWQLAVELHYPRRSEPMLLEHNTEQSNGGIPLLGFLPSLLADVSR